MQVSRTLGHRAPAPQFRLPPRQQRSAAASAIDLSKLTGDVYEPSDSDYEKKRKQYASSSHEDENRMKPAAIIYAKSDADVIAAIKCADANKIAVAVRTGGHQYSGASSTDGHNVQLDLSEAYTDHSWDEESGIFTVGVSLKLGQLNAELVKLDLFVPHGQCSHVRVGGHAHTGGYGLPGRAFGLFGDHIEGIRIITADLKARWIMRGTNDAEEAELFYATLGGSPGNFGVLTHLKLKPHRRADYPKARGMQIIVPYTKQGLEALLHLQAEMASNDALPADYDMCITVMGGLWEAVTGSVRDKSIARAAGGETGDEARNNFDHDDDVAVKYGFAAAAADDAMMRRAGFFDEWRRFFEIAEAPAVIIIWAEWANLEGANQSTADADKWFDNIKTAATAFVPLHLNITRDFKDSGMPDLTSKWVFKIEREYDMPYVKRMYPTRSKSLSNSSWVSDTVNQIHRAASQFKGGLRIAIQIQHYGGRHSRAHTNDPRKLTSYSWRDTSVVQIMDCFYKVDKKDKDKEDSKNGRWGEDPKKRAIEWQAKNDDVFNHRAGDRRMMWASYHTTEDEFDLMKKWRFYHESPEKFDKLSSIKRRVDPKNIFSPNKFSVRADIVD